MGLTLKDGVYTDLNGTVIVRNGEVVSDSGKLIPDHMRRVYKTVIFLGLNLGEITYVGPEGETAVNQTVLRDGKYKHPRDPDVFFVVINGVVTYLHRDGGFEPIPDLLLPFATQVCGLCPPEHFEAAPTTAGANHPVTAKEDAANDASSADAESGTFVVEISDLHALLKDGTYRNIAEPDQTVTVKGGIPVGFTEDVDGAACTVLIDTPERQHNWKIQLNAFLKAGRASYEGDAPVTSAPLCACACNTASVAS